MGLVTEIEKYLYEINLQIIHGKGNRKGNLPGLILKGLEEKKEALETVLQVFKKYENTK